MPLRNQVTSSCLILSDLLEEACRVLQPERGLMPEPPVVQPVLERLAEEALVVALVALVVGYP